MNIASDLALQWNPQLHMQLNTTFVHCLPFEEESQKFLSQCIFPFFLQNEGSLWFGGYSRRSVSYFSYTSELAVLESELTYWDRSTGFRVRDAQSSPWQKMFRRLFWKIWVFGRDLSVLLDLLCWILSLFRYELQIWQRKASSEGYFHLSAY